MHQHLRVKQLFNRLFTHHVLVSQAHAVSRQHTGHWMHQDARHAQRICHQTRVLSTSTAKALQGVARHVIATGHRDFFDGIGHLLHCNVYKTFSNSFNWSLHVFGECIELLLHHLSVKRLISLWAKYMWKVMGLDFSQQYIRVCHS